MKSRWREQSDEMLTFAVRWAPFGGGEAEDIWAQFGASERVFFLRLRSLLAGPPAAGLDELTWARLRLVCERRLLRPGPPLPASPDTDDTRSG